MRCACASVGLCVCARLKQLFKEKPDIKNPILRDLGVVVRAVIDKVGVVEVRSETKTNCAPLTLPTFPGPPSPLDRTSYPAGLPDIFGTIRDKGYGSRIARSGCPHSTHQGRCPNWHMVCYLWNSERSQGYYQGWLLLLWSVVVKHIYLYIR